MSGVGYHHAGLDVHDRNAMEELFLKGDLPVLSTLLFLRCPFEKHGSDESCCLFAVSLRLLWNRCELC